MYKLEIHLKQHTPMLHFQPGQNGATLRASEVKPKLDRFIIEMKGGWNHIPQEWKIKSDAKVSKALNYKLCISTTNIEEIDWKPMLTTKANLSFPCFFANMGDNNKDKYRLCLSKKPITLNFIVYSETLREYIVKWICNFFTNHTFGARQSKGFGTFFPTNDNPAFREIHASYSEPKKDYYFEVELSQDSDAFAKQETLFHHIDLFYKLLRSGLNKKGKESLTQLRDSKYPVTNRQQGYYCKPVIFTFLKEKDIQWDKKTIKERFLDVDYIQKFPSDADKAWLTDNPLVVKKWRIDTTTSDLKINERGLKTQLQLWRKSEVLTYSASTPHYLWRDLFGLSTNESWKSYKLKLTKTHTKIDKSGKWIPRSKDDPEIISRFASPIHFLPILSDNDNKCRVYFSCHEIPQLYRNAYFLISTNRRGCDPLPLKVGDISNLNEIIDWLIDNKDSYLSNHWNGSGNSEVSEDDPPAKKQARKDYNALIKILVSLCKHGNH